MKRKAQKKIIVSREESRRAHTDRKQVTQISVLNVKNIASSEVYFSRATVVDVSPTGLLLCVKRDDILAHNLRSTLTLSVLHGVSVGFTIEVMDTYLEGAITRTKSEGHGDFLAAVDFREDAPAYWRHCLVDLLPTADDSDPTGGTDGDTGIKVDADTDESQE